MKKLKLLFGIIISLLMFSCSSDDEPVIPIVEGSWRYVELISSKTGDKQILTECMSNSSLTFSDNFTGNAVDFFDFGGNDCGFEFNYLTYTLEESLIVDINGDRTEYTYEYTYGINGPRLILSYVEDQVTYTLTLEKTD